MTTEAAKITGLDASGPALISGFFPVVQKVMPILREAFSVVPDVVSGTHDFFDALPDATSTRSHTAELEQQFNGLADRWHQETGGLSNPSHIMRNSNYHGIIGLGEPVVPFILRDLRERGGYWYPALRMLTGASPTTREARGKPRLLDQQWFDWAKERGYPE